MVTIALAFMVWASADISSGIYLKSFCRKSTSREILALTFDDGPDEVMTPKVLDVLRQYDIKATFFLIGNRAMQNPQIVERIIAEGHVIGNHTYSHKSTFPFSCKKKVEMELRSCGKAIENITGECPRFFRPPYGVTNPIIGQVVRSHGLRSIGWSIRSLDTLSKRSRSEICAKIIRKVHPGAIILLHDRCKDADTLLHMLIPKIIEKGYKFTDIDNLIHNE